MLIGRGAERERIERLLSHARRGRSGALVVRGEAGIGKTTLLRYAVDLAEAMTVVTATGIESESEVEFSGLLELCRPLLQLLDAIPERQAATLRATLGLGPSREGDRFAVGAATLSLLAEAGEANAVVVLVDDAQWLDRASADAVRFAARRLDADRVSFLFAVRDDELHSADWSGFDEIRLAGLDLESARTLLARSTGTELTDDVSARIHAATGGSPLALTELPGLLSPEQFAGTASLEDPLPTGASVEQAFGRRAKALPQGTQRALLVAAASTSREVETVAAALHVLGLDTSVLGPAEDAGLLESVDGRLRFRHPLVRSAVYHAAAPSERRAAHRAVAESLSHVDDGTLQTWHMAAAAIGPDEEIAAALESVAARAHELSAHAAVAAALEKAARLTPAPAARAERLVKAAEAAWVLGDARHTLELLEAAEAGPGTPAGRARLLTVRGDVERRIGTQSAARALLLQAEALIVDESPLEAAKILMTAVPVSFWAGDLPTAVELARRLRVLTPRDETAIDAIAEATLGWILCLSGSAEEGRPSLERAAGLCLASDEPSRFQLYSAAVALSLLERTAESDDAALRALGRAREEAGPRAVLTALDQVTPADVRAGRWRLGQTRGEEGRALAGQLGQLDQFASLVIELARIDAARGDADRCRERIAEAVRIAEDHGIVPMRSAAQGVLGLLELGLGRFAEALEQLQFVATEIERIGLYDRDNSPHPDLIDVLVRIGRPGEAAEVLDRYAERAQQGTPVWGGALVARCRGVLAEDEEAASRHFGEALLLHDRVEDRFQRGRTLLAFGERLRRAGRRKESRERLREAHAIFEELEAKPWEDRARRELRASGERLRRAHAAFGGELTPQERQVALQVAEGKSNKEVAAALFLSPKTVEFHLSRVYRKLDLSSRAELIRRFAAGEAVAAA